MQLNVPPWCYSLAFCENLYRCHATECPSMVLLFSFLWKSVQMSCNWMSLHGVTLQLFVKICTNIMQLNVPPWCYSLAFCENLYKYHATECPPVLAHFNWTWLVPFPTTYQHIQCIRRFCSSNLCQHAISLLNDVVESECFVGRSLKKMWIFESFSSFMNMWNNFRSLGRLFWYKYR